MKVKVNLKKPTVMLTADKYSSMLEEMESLRRGLDQYKSWCANMNISLTDAREQVDALRGAIARKDAEVVERSALIQELNDQIEASEADRNITIAENERLRARMTEKDKTNDIAVRATSELADMVVTARNERDTARTEAEDLRLELMERGCRIEELEKQVEWLRDKNDEWAQVANDQKSTIINYEAVIQSLQEEVERWKRIAAEDVEMAKRFHHEALVAEEEAKRLKDSYDALYEQSTSNHANAEYWEDQTHKMEAEVDTLRRQLKANEEEYNNLRKMYVELRDAAAVAASHIRSNTVAN